MRKNKVVLIILLFIVGCVSEPPVNVYKVRQIRPDGVIHKEWTIRTHGKIETNYTWGGQSYIDFTNSSKNRCLTPVGWLLDVEYTGVEYANKTN